MKSCRASMGNSDRQIGRNKFSALRAGLLALCLGLMPGMGLAGCNGGALVQICPEGEQRVKTTRKILKTRVPEPAFKTGDDFPLDAHNVLMNPARYGLPKADGRWRYYKVEREVYRVDPTTRKVLGRVTDIRSALLP